MQMIIMTEQQAQSVTGKWELHEIHPVRLANGIEWVLPIECISNENYPQEVRELLATFPQREISAEESPQGEE